jgi:hypothetical protein
MMLCCILLVGSDILVELVDSSVDVEDWCEELVWREFVWRVGVWSVEGWYPYQWPGQGGVNQH